MKKKFLIIIIIFLLFNFGFLAYKNDIDYNLVMKGVKLEEDNKKIEQKVKSVKPTFSKQLIQKDYVGINEILNQKDLNEVIVASGKLLDIKFYSQFPLNNHEDPYQEFCEEASLLGSYYYLKGISPSISDYIKDLYKLKDIQIKLYGKNGYKNTDVIQSLITLIFFQSNEDVLDKFTKSTSQKEKDEIIGKVIKKVAQNNGIGGKILFSPSENNIKEAISKLNPVIVPLYGKGLGNEKFINGGPTLHNLIIKGYDEKDFITNEVGLTRGNSYKYSIKTILENNHDYFELLYSKKFTVGEARVLEIFKYDENNLESIDSNKPAFQKYIKDEFNKSGFQDLEKFKYEAFDLRKISNLKNKTLFSTDFSKLYDLIEEIKTNSGSNKNDLNDKISYQKLLIKTLIDGYYDEVNYPHILRSYSKDDFFINRNMNLNFLIDFKY